MPESRVTLQDVADEAGLSKAAASYALRGLKGSAQTQELVRGVAARLGYTANPAAQALAGGRSGAVGVCGALNDLWHQGLAVDVAGRLRAEGFSSSIADTDADPRREREVVEAMARDHLDGVMALVTDPSGLWWAELPTHFVVIAVGDVPAHRPDTPCVVFDNAHGVRMALEHLTSLGHRRIGLLTSTLPSSPGRPGEIVAARFAEDRGIELDVVPVSPSPRGAGEATRELLAGPRRPTALFCLSDSIAFAAYRAVREAGLLIPDDVSILGFDDHELADLVTPALSSFGWDEDAIGAAVVRLFVDVMDGESDVRAARVEFRPELVARASTAPPTRAWPST